MNSNAGVGKLLQAAKDLRMQWEETRVAWHDENCRRFEEEFVLPFLIRVRKVEQALTHLNGVLQKVHHDCE